MLKKVGFFLVLLMAVLQGFYGIFAYLDPSAFASVRGTALASKEDVDWIVIYASRTLFIAILIGFLIYLRQYKVLIVAALAGSVMPLTDAWLAYTANAPSQVLLKHIATVIYLAITASILRLILAEEAATKKNN